MKDIKISGSNFDQFDDEETESFNFEFYFTGTDVTVDVIDAICSRIDNYYDANGLTDIFDDSYDDGSKMIWKIEIFFNAEDVSDPLELS